jgi:hypothetical protein
VGPRLCRQSALIYLVPRSVRILPPAGGRPYLRSNGSEPRFPFVIGKFPSGSARARRESVGPVGMDRRGMDKAGDGSQASCVLIPRNGQSWQTQPGLGGSLRRVEFLSDQLEGHPVIPIRRLESR